MTVSALAMGCAPQPDIPPQTLVVSLTSDPKTFNTIVAKETSSTVVLSRIFEGLTETNAVTKEVEPLLARKWEKFDNGKRWRFYLRQDVQWRDGHPFTAEDVVFTFRRLIYNNKVSTSARFIFLIEGQPIQVKKISRYVVEFQLPKPFVPFLRALSQPILPKHILAPVVRAGNFDSTWGINTDPKKIIGTGPYYISEFEPGERVVLKANPRYWRKGKDGKKLPYIQHLYYLIVKDRNAERILFESGITDSYNMQPKDWGLLYRQRHKENYRMLNLGPGQGSAFLVFNLNPGRSKKGKPFIDPARRKIFEKLHFRRAIAHSIDKESIIKNYFYNLGTKQFTGMWEESPFYTDTVRRYPFDLDKAKKLLDKAGLQRKDEQGYRLMPGGERFYFTLSVRSESQSYQKIANQLVADLKKIGIQVHLKPILFNNLVQKLTSTFDWEATFIGLTGGIEPHFGRNVWHSSGPLHMWHPRQKSPHRPWEQEIDDIFDQGVSELNHKKRVLMYRRWQRLVARYLPFIYTVKTPILYAVRDKFVNLNPTAFGGLYHNLERLKLKSEYR